MTRSERIGDYLDQLGRLEEAFREEQSLDSSTWNLTDAREAANFYMHNFSYSKLVLERARVDMHQLEDELNNVLDVFERWSQESPFKEQA